MPYKCTEERFLKDIENHTMEVLLDNEHMEGEVYRHLKFTNNGSNVYRYDLITYPGGLIIRGDMGTYVFERTYDMFEFFWMSDNDFNNHPEKKLNINPGYWAEKLQAQDKQGEYQRWSEDQFTEEVKEHIEDFLADHEWPEYVADRLRDAVKEDILDRRNDNGYTAYENVSDFDFESLSDEEEGEFKFYFDAYDIFEGGFDEYTFHYIWCLYAIVHGIKTYRQSKEK